VHRSPCCPGSRVAQHAQQPQQRSRLDCRVSSPSAQTSSRRSGSRIAQCLLARTLPNRAPPRPANTHTAGHANASRSCLARASSIGFRVLGLCARWDIGTSCGGQTEDWPTAKEPGRSARPKQGSNTARRNTNYSGRLAVVGGVRTRSHLATGFRGLGAVAGLRPAMQDRQESAGRRAKKCRQTPPRPTRVDVAAKPAGDAHGLEQLPALCLQVDGAVRLDWGARRDVPQVHLAVGVLREDVPLVVEHGRPAQPRAAADSGHWAALRCFRLRPWPPKPRDGLR
jgi:hypothetical protein